MEHDTTDRPWVDDGESDRDVRSTAFGRSSPPAPETKLAPGVMSISSLAAEFRQEISDYRRGDPSAGEYGVELFRRATISGNQDAWVALQQCLSEVMLIWLRCHPNRRMTRFLDSEENYVAQAFERFWLATSRTQKVEFQTLAAALCYLRMSLNSVLLDTQRTYIRPKEVLLPDSGDPREPLVEGATCDTEVWEAIKGMLPNAREQRLAYLLFHCGLKPGEIVRLCPLEWNSVHEVYRLKRNIMERLLRKADQLRWQLDPVN